MVRDAAIDQLRHKDSTNTVHRRPYPIMDLLSTGQRVILFTVSAGLMTGSTLALKWIYGKLNGIEELKEEAKHPLKSQ
jgi:hypothetical protein